MSDIHEILNQISVREGFSQWGVTSLQNPMTFLQYKSWIEADFHGDMKYLETHLPIKESPQLQFPLAHSSLVFTFPYFPELNSMDFPIQSLRVASYAKNTDYHYWIKERLERIIQALRSYYPDAFFQSCVDSSPILERDLASRAGLGWFGKNTCLIHPKKGSLFFICEILTSLELDVKTSPLPDFCGNCTRCIEICPTGALEEPRLLNAKKCISYWTIESRSVPPEEIRSKMGDWFFGCDLCQNVCPWNQKIFKTALEVQPQRILSETQRQTLIEELRFILQSSGKKLQKIFALTPLARAGSFGLKRNALIIIGNHKLYELKAEVELFLENQKLSELSKWTLSELHSGPNSNPVS